MLQSIHEYYAEVENVVQYGDTKNETAISNPFFNLLNEYAKQYRLKMVRGVRIKTPEGNTIEPDGTLKDSRQQNWGYWESKDEYDDLNEEIEKKFAKGYPKDNILFEDGKVAVSFQKDEGEFRCYIQEANDLHHLLTEFFSYEQPGVKNFRHAIELFKEDVPK